VLSFVRISLAGPFSPLLLVQQANRPEIAIMVKYLKRRFIRNKIQ